MIGSQENLKRKKKHYLKPTPLHPKSFEHNLSDESNTGKSTSKSISIFTQSRR